MWSGHEPQEDLDTETERPAKCRPQRDSYLTLLFTDYACFMLLSYFALLFHPEEVGNILIRNVSNFTGLHGVISHKTELVIVIYRCNHCP